MASFSCAILTLGVNAAFAQNISGTKGPDSIVGTADGDSIDGLAGNDHIDALAGNDALNGNYGHDTLVGGDGDDNINGRSGNDVIYLNTETTASDPQGNDQDAAFGGENDDTIYAQDSSNSGDADYVNCGNGFDTAFVDANDTTIGCETIILAP